MQLPLQPDQALVLFDGECAVCDASVMFIIDRDPAGHFVFAPLQSDLGQGLLREHCPELAATELSTLVLLDAHGVYTQSNAVLRIASRLRGPIKFLAMLLAIPRGLRDPFYRAFAARRRRWFGTLEQCRIPTPEIRRRFVA